MEEKLMVTKKKYQCDTCEYYWEIELYDKSPAQCPVCRSFKVHKSARHKRFAKKSRPKIRRVFLNK